MDASGEMGEARFEDIFGLKKLLLEGQDKIAYNFAKKFFEYANGYEPDLKQRLYLWNFVGSNPGHHHMRDLLTEVLAYSLTTADQ